MIALRTALGQLKRGDGVSDAVSCSVSGRWWVRLVEGAGFVRLRGKERGRGGGGGLVEGSWW